MNRPALEHLLAVIAQDRVDGSLKWHRPQDGSGGHLQGHLADLERFPSELNRGFPWAAERWRLGM
jgi:hypothetical protein